jgi:hypothetical protein
LAFPLRPIASHHRQSTMTIALAEQDLSHLIKAAIAL